MVTGAEEYEIRRTQLSKSVLAIWWPAVASISTTVLLEVFDMIKMDFEHGLNTKFEP
jgi:hypothetical protein